jgi:adenylosuccinate lyase
METLDALHALSPADGRYAARTFPLRAYFSEAGLMRYRVKVEVAYFLALDRLQLPQMPRLTEGQKEAIWSRWLHFSEKDLSEIKALEQQTNHDVKAVEYLVRQWVQEAGCSAHAAEFVHFGLTSQDINNTAIPMLLKDAEHEVLYPALQELVYLLRKMVGLWKELPMLSFTHGQPASPTRLGKEMMVFVARLEKQMVHWEAMDYEGKFGGASGNFNAHLVAFPQIDWPGFADHFLKTELGLTRQTYTTQIEHYDQLAARCDLWKRISMIAVDACRDLWQYISLGYFTQQTRSGEVGSSAMPHKVNPIDFENAEGNLLFAVSMLEFFAHKLPVSRLQRDLTDSTVLRNLGLPFAHILIALQALRTGLHKIQPNAEAMMADLQANPMVLAEAIQTILRREGYPKPYEALRDFTRTGRTMDLAHLHAWIENLSVSEEVKAELRELKPEHYTGIA